MAEVAQANGVPFVDLFAPSQRVVCASATRPLTINGVHLTDEGYRQLAPAMFEALFGGSAARRWKTASFEELRQAVNEKNAVWFSRYRTVDGYNVYGGRSFMKYNGRLNRDAMQREMEMRDVMTANRDGASGPWPGQRSQGRRQQSAAHRSRSRATSPGPIPTAHTSSSAARKRSST